MLGSSAVWRPPSVFLLCVFYLYPLPATVKHIALYKAPLATPQKQAHSADCHRAAAAEDHTWLSK